MTNKVDSSQSRGTPPEHTYKVRRDRAVAEGQEQVRKLTREIEQMKRKRQ